MPEKKEPIKRSFSSPEEMAKHAIDAYKIGIKKENKLELDAGFDVYNYDSIMAFEPEYTLTGYTVMLKEIPKNIDNNDQNGLALIDNSISAKQFWVLQAGLMISHYRKGDIVSLIAGKIEAHQRKIKGVYVQIFDANVIEGIYLSRDLMKQRIENADAEIRAKQTGIAYT